MKKFLSIVLVTVLVLALFAPLTVSALPSKFTMNVPYGDPSTAGIGADWGTPNVAAADALGWDGALATAVPFNYYLRWSDKGMYVATDMTLPNPVAKNDGSGLDASHGGNCDRFQIAFNPGNARTPDQAPIWFTWSMMEDGSFHIVREDAGAGAPGEDVTAQCQGTTTADGGKFTTSILIPWSVINIDDTKFTAQAGLKMDIHIGICFAGDNATAIGGGEKIEITDPSPDAANVWSTGAMPMTLNFEAPAPAGPVNPFQRMTATAQNTEHGEVVNPNGNSPTTEMGATPDAIYNASKLFHLYWDTDSSTWAHGGVNTIAYMAPYGIGYGHSFGTVYLENLDFGANGANKITVSLTNTTEPFAGLGVYLDVNPVKDKNAQPIAVIKDVLTDGFEDVNAKDFSVDVSIPGGVHTVYFMYQGMDVGSLFGVEFTEAPAAAVAAPVEAVGGGEAADAEVAPVVQAAVTAAPQTGDGSIALIILILAVVSSAVVFVKKAKSRV